jgi:hypothetical protein
VMDMTSCSSRSLSRPGGGGGVGERLSDGEGRNKGVLDECRGGTLDRDDEEQLAVSKGGSGPYHMTYTYRQADRRMGPRDKHTC